MNFSKKNYNHKKNSSSIVSKTMATVLLTVFALFAMEVDAQTTRYVNPTGTDAGNCTDSSNACATIDYAMGMAGSGDIIDIASGVYTEQLNIEKDLTLQGAGDTQPGGTIIQAHASPGQAAGRTITIGSGHTVLMTGLMIRHGAGVPIGGGILNSNANLTLTDVAFADNTADYGGGLYNSSGSATLIGVSFTNNTAAYNGGGIFTDSDLMLTGSSFTDNTAEEGDGGAINIFNSTTTFNGVTFTGNTSENNGGAISLLFDSTGSFTDVTFTGNETLEGFGGAVYITESNADFTDAHFINNQTPTNGGAVYITESSADFSSSTFIGNEARLGGGLLIQTQSTATLYDVLFEGNKVPISSSGMASGGGMAVLGSDATIHNTHFKDNEAGVFGGGLVNEAANTTLVNTLFTGNIANKAGGAIANAGDLDITNTTISKNEGLDDGAGGVYSLGGTVTLQNSIVWGNIGPEAPNIANANGAVLTGNYSLYDDTDVFNEGTFTCDDCLTLNPEFADATGGDFTLSANSPAIDTGDPNTNFSEFPTDGNNNPIDLAGNARVYNNTIDMGAYEFSSLSINDFGNTTLQVAMYPNPVNDLLHIETEQEITNISLYSITGQQLQTWKNQSSIDLSTYAPGIYLVKITTQNSSVAKQVIKK